MKKNARVKEKTFQEKILKYLHRYAYLESSLIVLLYLVVGYLLDPDDICILDSKIPFLLIILTVITLFHGFESGVLSLAIISLFMHFFYDSFPYVNFLVALMMTLLYGEFHYYWNQRIKKAEINSNYKGIKLDELSKAFYALKISHDQLEKNYVVKPMSIRNALDQIIANNKEILADTTIEDKQAENYKRFMDLIQKSFHVNSGLILYRRGIEENDYFQEKLVNIVYGEYTEKVQMSSVFENYLVDKAIARKTPIYISDDEGEPSLDNELESRYIAAIPAIYDKRIITLLAIEKMPFMAFNRENLTSIAILLEFVTIELRKRELMPDLPELEFLEDKAFKIEVKRLHILYEKYSVNSIFLVLKMTNELQALRMNEKITLMLRSLDMSTYLEKNGKFYIAMLFPLHDKAATLGFLNRLKGSLIEEDKEFLYMTFDFSQLDLFHDYFVTDGAGV